MRTKKIKSEVVDNVDVIKTNESTLTVETPLQVDVVDTATTVDTAIVVEKKKRGRKKLIKPDATNTSASLNSNYKQTDSLNDDCNSNTVIEKKITSTLVVETENGSGIVEKKQRKVRVSKKQKYDEQQAQKGQQGQQQQQQQPHTSDVISHDDITIKEEMLQLSTSNIVVHKKRGRKPRGGKIIHENQLQKNNNPEVPNIILHLKCVLSDLKKSNDVNSHKLDDYCNEKKMEILCYNDNDNDQNNTFTSNVSNVTKFDSENNATHTLCRRVITTKEEEKNDENLMPSSPSNIKMSHQKYDPSTFSSKNIHPTPIPMISETTTTSTSTSINTLPFYFPENEVTSGDYNLECKNATNKEIWKKISQLKLNFHKNDALGVQRSACFWDTCEFDTPPIYIPMSASKGYGCFCHPECAVAFLMNENIDTSIKFERYYLLNSIYGPIYNYNKSIKPAANPHYILNKFYGNLTINEYRKLFQCEQVVYMVNKPLTNVLPELYEDNNDFFIGNKIIQNSTIEIKKKGTKSAKSSIINEAFGIR